MKRLITLGAVSLCILLAAESTLACDGNYFHIDDFAGLPAGFAPIQGTQSLWCGRRAGPDFCSPGTGHSWDECWESCEFEVTDDMTFAFEIEYNSEAGYDYTRAEYLNASDTWVTLAQYWGDGAASENFVISSGLLGTTVRFRFLFQSDNSWDNEDCLTGFLHGACFIDNVSIEAGATQVNFQDFEAEPVFALETLDGKWQAGPHPGCAPIPVEQTTWGRVKSLYR